MVLTMMLAIYLAKEVTAILRAVLTHETKKLYDERTVQLLCSNYWIQPIYQEERYRWESGGGKSLGNSKMARADRATREALWVQ